VRRLYAEHAGPLFAFVLRLTSGDWQRAEDIVQETLLRAWRHPEALAPERGSPRPWLFAVARRIAVDAHRRRRARPQEIGDGDAVLAQIPAQDDDVDRALDAWLVSDALAALSAPHREVLAQTYFAGRSVAEAARVLGVPPGTVKSRTHYALQALRLALLERGVTP